MTLREVVGQLMQLSVDKMFSGKKFTKYELERHIRRTMNEKDIRRKKLDMEITLPDGKWELTVFYIPAIEKGFYDYEIGDPITSGFRT